MQARRSRPRRQYSWRSHGWWCIEPAVIVENEAANVRPDTDRRSSCTGPGRDQADHLTSPTLVHSDRPSRKKCRRQHRTGGGHARRVFRCRQLPQSSKTPREQRNRTSRSAAVTRALAPGRGRGSFHAHGHIGGDGIRRHHLDGCQGARPPPGGCIALPTSFRSVIGMHGGERSCPGRSAQCGRCHRFRCGAAPIAVESWCRHVGPPVDAGGSGKPEAG